MAHDGAADRIRAAGMPASQLAILPGTSRVTLVDRGDLLLPILQSFLDAPMPEAG